MRSNDSFYTSVGRYTVWERTDGTMATTDVLRCEMKKQLKMYRHVALVLGAHR